MIKVYYDLGNRDWPMWLLLVPESVPGQSLPAAGSKKGH
jgi:hypothetical protein